MANEWSFSKMMIYPGDAKGMVKKSGGIKRLPAATGSLLKLFLTLALCAMRFALFI